MKTINELIKNLINENDDISINFSKIILNKYEKDGFVLKNYFKDFVDQESLIKLIIKSINNESIQMYLPDILFLVEENSFTDDFVKQCLLYPNEFKETLLIQLSHIWLTEKQLEAINNEMETNEAFNKLVVINLRKQNETNHEFVDFLLRNKKRLKFISNLENYIKSEELNQNRVNILKNILKEIK